MSPELQQAVKERVELGHSQEQITAELREAGYDDATIASVYGATVDENAVPIPDSAELPSAITLFKQAWSFALSRPDLIALLMLPTLLINGFGVALEMGWLPLGAWLGVGLLVGFLALVFLQFLLQLTLAHTALTTRKTGGVTLTDSWNWATSHVWPWLWIATLSFCVVFGGLLLFIIPGVIVSFYIAFAIYAYIDQDARGMSALQRSRALVTGNFWEVLSRLVVFILILLGLAIVAGIAISLLAVALGSVAEGVGQLTLSVFDALLTAFASVLGVYFAASLYIALKQRSTTSVPPSGAYPILGWLGALVILALLALGGFGVGMLINQVGPQGFDLEQMMNSDMQAQMQEQAAELSPEEQAEFEAFMEEFGAELGDGSVGGS